MSETKWISGPWHVDPDLVLRRGYTAISAEDHYGLAQVVSRMDDADEDDEYTATLEASARLIAAAPELYEALEECKRVLSDLQSTQLEGTRTRAAWEKARAALAKARGE